MRAYFWGNMYLSQIQQGIQTAHCLADMYEKYRNDSHMSEWISLWAQDHKTMILLNGGFSEYLRELVRFFSEEGQNAYPWAQFHEAPEALDNALTCVGIILPSIIYNGAAAIRNTSLEEVECGSYNNPNLLADGLRHDFWKRLTPFEQELCMRLNQYGLA